MFKIANILLIVLSGLTLCGCFGGARPSEVLTLDLKRYEVKLIEDIVLTRRVILERGREKKGFYSSKKEVEVTATSKFGLEHEIANLDCIISGIHHTLENPIIIPTAEFWETIGRNKDTLTLSTLFDERESFAAKNLNLDYLVIAYNQRIDVESYFMEGLAGGGYTDEERELATVVTIDMKNMREIDATEIKATYFKAVGHAVAIVPMARFDYPDEDPCALAGRYAAKAVLNSHNTDSRPRIVVVAGDLRIAMQEYKWEPPTN